MAYHVDRTTRVATIALGLLALTGGIFLFPKLETVFGLGVLVGGGFLIQAARKVWE